MAEKDANENEQEGDDAEGSGGGKKKIILLAILGVLLIGISVGGTLAVLSLFGAEEPAPENGEMVEEAPEAMQQAIYYPLKPSIIVSFEARGRQRYLQADITLMTREDEVIAAVETHMPMIRNALVMLIGGQLYEEIQTAEGKELLRVQCLQELQRLLEQEIGKPGIEQVLFTNLVMQ